eukprot:TRINITY_DN50032_c0_g1_i1.p1 TRINITY_DN50032_c0_g1~~TRINITY_DN50032_c0_g1_i1.p1  ORF type:complete len:485 (+),score=130.79 TRINITY_DN50032_c0_g1_i1:76-1455(+)
MRMHQGGRAPVERRTCGPARGSGSAACSRSTAGLRSVLAVLAAAAAGPAPAAADAPPGPPASYVSWLFGGAKSGPGAAAPATPPTPAAARRHSAPARGRRLRPAGPGSMAGHYVTNCSRIPVVPPVFAQFCTHWMGSGFWLSQAWEQAVGAMNDIVHRGGKSVSRSKWAKKAHLLRTRNATNATAAGGELTQGNRSVPMPKAELMPEEEIEKRRRAHAAATKTRCSLFPGHPLIDVMTELAASPKDHALVDVGSNIGHYSMFGLSLGRTVYAFEPIQSLISKQCESMMLTRRVKGLATVPIYIHRVAVGSRAHREINITRPVTYLGDFDSSSVVATNVGHINTKYKTVEKVPMVRLDDVLPADLKVGVLKIDVQGLEGSVLLGAPRTLSRTRFVVWERREGMMRATGHQTKKVLKWLKVKHGFDCIGCGGGKNSGDWCCLRQGLERAPLPKAAAHAKVG